MHHIFHGVVAAIMVLFSEIMKEHEMGSAFDRAVNPHMIELQQLRLHWCRVKTFPKSQWVYEDELGYSRVSPFAYGLFFRNMKRPARKNTSDASWMALQQILSSLVAMLMSPRVPNLAMIDRHVKVFLSCCNRFCQSYYTSATVPFLAAKGNFISLLNLHDQIARHGPLRWYWEGTRERYIQSVKKVLSSMRKTSSYFERKIVIMQKLTVLE
ncbi:hypothetical protein ACHAWF_002243 [Thalassiosira exigua]